MFGKVMMGISLTFLCERLDLLLNLQLHNDCFTIASMEDLFDLTGKLEEVVLAKTSVFETQ